MKIILSMLVMMTSTLFAQDLAPTQYQVDEIQVYKSKHRMHMMFEGKITKTYKVMLGRGGMDPKRKEGDNLVPEGNYDLDYRNPQSKFYKSLHISYPNAYDIERARREGVKPGGDIFVHGMPNNLLEIDDVLTDLGLEGIDDETVSILFPRIDWTAGCVAVKNDEMEEIWQNVQVPTKFTIYH
jgi:murein L,D-transpeptidase YafK